MSIPGYCIPRGIQKSNLWPRDPRDDLYELQCCTTVVQIMQTDRLLAWGALSATATFYSVTCTVFYTYHSSIAQRAWGTIYNQPCWLSQCLSEDYPYSSGSTGSILIWTSSNLTSNTESGFWYVYNRKKYMQLCISMTAHPALHNYNQTSSSSHSLPTRGTRLITQSSDSRMRWWCSLHASIIRKMIKCTASCSTSNKHAWKTGITCL